MAAGDFAGKILKATAGVMSEIDPKSTLKYMGKNAGDVANSRAYKAGKSTANFLGGGVRDTVKNMNKTTNGSKMGFKQAIKEAHSTKITDAKVAKELGKNVGDSQLNMKKVAGTAIGVSMAGRVVTGGGLYKDKNGNFNLPGVPFV